MSQGSPGGEGIEDRESRAHTTPDSLSLTPRVVMVGYLQTGPGGQIWDVKGRLKRGTYYGLVEIGPVSEENE